MGKLFSGIKDLIGRDSKVGALVESGIEKFGNKVIDKGLEKLTQVETKVSGVAEKVSGAFAAGLSKTKIQTQNEVGLSSKTLAGFVILVLIFWFVFKRG